LDGHHVPIHSLSMIRHTNHFFRHQNTIIHCLSLKSLCWVLKNHVQPPLISIFGTRTRVPDIPPFVPAPRHAYWKGVLSLGEDAIATAETLVEQRIVACAQAAPDGRQAAEVGMERLEDLMRSNG